MIINSSINNFDDADLFPSIGFSDVTQEDVEQAVDFIIKDWATTYFETMKQAIKERGLWSPGLQGFRHSSRYSDITIYPDAHSKYELLDINKGRLYISFVMKAKEMKGKNQLEKLLIPISEKLFALGYQDLNAGEFFIGLEKGRVNKSTDHWHFDKFFKKSITVCWSNIKNWSTHILNLEKHSDEWNALNNEKKNMVHYSFDDKTLDLSKAESARFGYLYDALNVVHRSPRPADLENPELDVNDYRLFIRYTEAPK